MSRPSKTTAPFGRLDEAGDRLQQRRLAGAVGAEQRDDLALVDLEVRRRTAPARCRSARRRCGRAAASPRPAGARSSTSACAAVDVHTRLMSLHDHRARRREDHAPIRKIGTMRRSPARMPYASASRRRWGAGAGPGRMNSAAIAKPIDRTLGGIASDSAAKIAGTSSTTTPGDDHVHDDRDRRGSGTARTPSTRPRPRADDRDEAEDERRALQQQPGDERVPASSPTSCAGSTNAATKPRSRSSRSKTCS